MGALLPQPLRPPRLASTLNRYAANPCRDSNTSSSATYCRW